MSETIGQKLKRAREEKRLTIAQVVEQTRIRSHYLEALERDDLSSIPSAAQARGFLRVYSDFLGLKPDSASVDIQPSERTLAYQPSAASTLDASTPLNTEPQAAPAQEAVSAPEPARPNLLSSLRERFMRRDDSTSVEEEPVDAAPAPSTALSESKGLEPEPFVPVRYTEELPAAPEPSTAEEVKPDKELPAEKISAPVTKPSRKKIAAADSKTIPAPRRKSAKPRAVTSKTGDKQTVVKKKIVQTSTKKKSARLRSGSSPRKLSSSRPRRPLTKTKKSNRTKTSGAKLIRKTSKPLSRRKSAAAALSPKRKKSRKK